jgi:response regulator RpfG family c-di-GMP phosphodiesterase
MTAVTDRQEAKVVSTGQERILVIGQASPLLEGVVDLLQLADYQVEMSSSLAETSYALHVAPPNLAIVDLSGFATDAVRISEQIRSTPRWDEVPILFISFSGDDRIRDLQGRTNNNHNGRVEFYAHTVLSIDGLLNKVGACMA